VKKVLSIFLPKEKVKYLFSGISGVITDCFISILPKIKERKFNKFGINKIKRNIFALQQGMANLIDGKEINFEKIQIYYELLNFTEKEIYTHIISNKSDPIFTKEQYMAILSIESPNRKIIESFSNLNLIFQQIA
jgi:hypothetical protein